MGQPAAKANDRITATDTHIVMVVAGPSLVPTPLPHVFAGTIDSGVVPTVTIAGQLAATVGSIAHNLPPHLLVPLTELASTSERTTPITRIAAVVDVRARGFFTHLQESLAELRERGWQPNLVFLDATDEALVRRFESVRRPHPLQGQGRLLDGIVRERDLLQDLRADAQVVIDTSGHPEPPSFKVLSSTNQAFNEPAREMIMKSVYRPGRVRGQAVRVQVQQAVGFNP